MRILSIESSCDETSAAVVEKVDNRIIVHSNVTATSLTLHAATGGIIPENAARAQVKYIIPTIREALAKSKTELSTIDAIAVTYGPGLIGSLLVGVETAKTLSFALDKPLIPVNHLLAHIYANFISTINHQLLTINYPFIGLIVSGGHTDLLLFKDHGSFIWLGGTRDDAAGEALDKIGRLLGLPYPAGSEIEKRAVLGEKTKLRFHSPMLGEDTFDFSFSGLKTEVARYVQNTVRGDTKRGTPIERPQRVKRVSMSDGGAKWQDPERESRTNEVCFAVQKAVVDVLVRKTLKAAEKYNVQTILLGGGVSANKKLLEQFQSSVKSQLSHVTIFSPEKKYCTDNAAMIGAYALLNPRFEKYSNIYANPNLYFS